MRLPVELRLYIYELVFGATLGERCVGPETLRHAGEEDITQHACALLATNRQLFFETMPVLYNHVQLYAEYSNLLPRYALRHIRDLDVLIHYASGPGTCCRTTAMYDSIHAKHPQLRHLTIYFVLEHGVHYTYDFMPVGEMRVFEPYLQAMLEDVLRANGDYYTLSITVCALRDQRVCGIIGHYLIDERHSLLDKVVARLERMAEARGKPLNMQRSGVNGSERRKSAHHGI